MSEPATVPAPTTRIVIVSGNEYQVPIATTEQELRAHLATMFPDVTNATLQKGKRKVEGVEYETWEFVKRAGTKGADGAELAALLAHVPPLPAAPLSPAARDLLLKIQNGNCTIDEALAGDLITIVNTLPASRAVHTGGSLCDLVDLIPPAAGSDIAGW